MRTKIKKIILISCIVLFHTVQGKSQYKGTKIITENLYPDCIELTNKTTRVVLEPNLGGRVLVYELKGKNILYIIPGLDGKLYEPGVPISPSAGRSDIGPEDVVPPHPVLFLGKWEGKITGTREAEMTSQKDTATGVQLVRKFRLAKKGSSLEFTQVIRNVSNEAKSYCHWSRTFVKGGGISLSPVDSDSKYPKGYIIREAKPKSIDYSPAEEENVRVREGILEIMGPPSRPKFYTDSYAGWLAYITKDNQLFVKKFPVYPDRIYGDNANATVSIYYYTRGDFCEIEPIGPMEFLKPGEEASFTEKWYLFDYEYPEDKNTDLKAIKEIFYKLN